MDLLSKEFADSALDKEEASSLSIGYKHSENVVINANKNGLYLERLDYSPITGGKGNVEYISLFSLAGKNNEVNIDEIIEKGKALKN